MSTPHISAHRRAKNFLFLGIFLTLFLCPQTSAADTLPQGVVEQQSCGSYNVSIMGYGAGMMQNPEPVKVTNARVSLINMSENCAVVQWESNTPAATQVLFTELVNEPVSIELSKENFGYSNATVQNNSGNSSHTAILTGLEPGKAYAYRLVTRSHPSAVPTISDPQVLIASPVVVLTLPQPVVTPTPPVVIAIPTTTSSPVSLFDSEKFPVAVTKPEGPVTSVPEELAPETEVTAEPEVEVPAAVTAAEDAFGNSRESHFWNSLKGFFSKLTPDSKRWSLSSNIGLFERDRYIVPTLFFLGLLFLLQQLVLPALGMTVKNPLLYWLLGAVALTVVSAVFMLYYVTLVGIALFLGLLAWYLIKSVPEEGDGVAIQPKLLETSEAKKKLEQKDSK